MSKNDFQTFYHIILVTSLSKPLITDELKSILYDYLEIKSKSMNCCIVKLGGTEDHVHIAITIPPTFAVNDIIEDLKNCFVNYIKKNMKESRFDWQTGFFMRTFSPEELQLIETYIDSQIIYHSEKTNEDEFKNFYQT
jgi:putative transposase